MSGDSTETGQSMAERWRRSQLDTARAKAEEIGASTRPDESATPTRCPACRSNDILTTSKVVSADAYWRCCGCGEVWNAGRLRSGSRDGRPGFRR